MPEGEVGRFVEDAPKYNVAALKIMKKHGVLVNDIYAKSKEIHAEHGTAPDNVHYTKSGSKELAKLITDVLEREL